jgi:adenine deaminase
MSMKKNLVWVLSLFIFIGLTSLAGAAAKKETADSSILIRNVNVFNGTDESLIPGQAVLIKGNKIVAVGESISAPKGATIINGRGRTLTPGFYRCAYPPSVELRHS